MHLFTKSNAVLLSLLCLIPTALSVVVPGAPPTPGPSGVGRDVEPVDIFAAAAANSIDLTKVPAWEPIPALNITPIIPGPGLPTLQELGLTWADITKPLPESDAAPGTLDKRYTPRCRGDINSFRHSNGLWCYNYLNGLGTTPCTVPSNGWIQMCWTGDNGAWSGWSISGVSETSTCAEVAAGGKWVLDVCKPLTDGKWYGWNEYGTNAAWDNGMLIVQVGTM